MTKQFMVPVFIQVHSRGLMRRLSWALLLPFFLVFVQQGELRHEIGHFKAPTASCSKQAPVDNDHCAVCLAFAHLAGAAKPQAFTFYLITGLTFSNAFEVFSADESLPALTPKSRGPPIF